MCEEQEWTYLLWYPACCWFWRRSNFVLIFSQSHSCGWISFEVCVWHIKQMVNFECFYVEAGGRGWWGHRMVILHNRWCGGTGLVWVSELQSCSFSSTADPSWLRISFLLGSQTQELCSDWQIRSPWRHGRRHLLVIDMRFIQGAHSCLDRMWGSK